VSTTDFRVVIPPSPNKEDAVKAIARRLFRLKDLLGGATGKPPEVFRLTVRHLGHKPDLEGATCRRRMWPADSCQRWCTWAAAATVGANRPGTGRVGCELSHRVWLASTKVQFYQWPPSLPLRDLWPSTTTSSHSDSGAFMSP
jgi:hypothetical protein